MKEKKEEFDSPTNWAMFPVRKNHKIERFLDHINQNDIDLYQKLLSVWHWS